MTKVDAVFLAQQAQCIVKSYLVCKKYEKRKEKEQIWINYLRSLPM